MFAYLRYAHQQLHPAAHTPLSTKQQPLTSAPAAAACSKKIAIPGRLPLRCVAWGAESGWIACGGDNALLKVIPTSSILVASVLVSSCMEIHTQQQHPSHQHSVVCAGVPARCPAQAGCSSSIRRAGCRRRRSCRRQQGAVTEPDLGGSQRCSHVRHVEPRAQQADNER